MLAFLLDCCFLRDSKYFLYCFGILIRLRREKRVILCVNLKIQIYKFVHEIVYA